MDVRAKKENLFIRRLWFPQVQRVRQDMKEEIRAPCQPGEQDVEIERVAIDPHSQQHQRHDVERGAMRRLKSRLTLAFPEDRKTEIHNDENQTNIEIAAPLWKGSLRGAGDQQQKN